MSIPVAELNVEIGADTTDFDKGIQDVDNKFNKTAENLAKASGGFTAAWGSAAKSLKEFGINIPLTPMDALGESLRFAGEYARESVEKLQAYALNVGNISRVTGMTAENSSRLIQAVDDVGISYEKLNTAMLAASRQGIDTSIEGMKKLSEKYLSLNPGVERAEFLMKTFGKSGSEMGKFMEQGADGIQKLSDSIGEGLILTAKDLQETEKLRIAQDNLNDSADSLSMTLAKKLVPAMNQVVNGLDILINLPSKVAEGLKIAENNAITGAQSYEQYVESIKYINNNLPPFTKNMIIMSEAEWEQAKAVAEIEHNTDSWVNTWQKLPPEIDKTSGALDAGASYQERYTKAAAEVAAGLYKTTIANKSFRDGMGQTAITAEWAAKTIEVQLKRAMIQAEAAALGLSVAMSGALGKENKSFEESSKKLEEEMAKIGGEIDALQTKAATPIWVVVKTEKGKEEMAGMKASLDDTGKAIDALNMKRLSGSLTAEEKKELEELKAKLKELSGQYKDNAAAHDEATKRILYDMTLQRLSIGGLSSEEQLALAKLQKDWGLIDQATYQAYLQIDAYASELEAGKLSGEGLANVIAGLSDKDIQIRVFYATYGQAPSDPVVAGAKDDAKWTSWKKYNPKGTKEQWDAAGRPAMAEGGFAQGGRPYLIGEKGPELFVPDRSGAVIPNDILTKISKPTTTYQNYFYFKDTTLDEQQLERAMRRVELLQAV